MDGHLPYPATVIAKQLDMSVSKVRYHMKKLKEAGYVESPGDLRVQLLSPILRGIYPVG